MSEYPIKTVFIKYLNKLNIPFMCIDKNILSKIFISDIVFIPNFIIQTKKGAFFIDVKNRIKNVKDNFYLSKNEINELFKLQNISNLPVWVAFSDNLDTPKFKYSPITEINHFYNEINENIIKKIDSTSGYYNKNCYIHIPEIFFENNLPNEKGYDKELSSQFIENEAKYFLENNNIETIKTNKHKYKV